MINNSQTFDVTSTVNSNITKIHTIILVMVCALFGVINIASGSLVAGAITIGAGLVTAAVVLSIRNKVSLIATGTFLTQIQLLIIYLYHLQSMNFTECFRFLLLQWHSAVFI